MNYSYGKTQKELANELNVDQTHLNNYKRLKNLIPELQEMVEEGKLKPNSRSLRRTCFLTFCVAFNIMKNSTY